MAILVLTRFGDTAAWERRVVVTGEILGGTGWGFFVASQKRRDIFGSADAFEELVDPQTIGPVETGALLGHQAEIGRGIQRGLREMVNRRAGACVVQLGVEDIKVRGIGTDLIFGKVGATFIRKCTDRHKLHPVAGRAYLGIDLQTALQLVGIEGPERPFEREVKVFDMRFTTGGESSGTCKAQGDNSRKEGFLDHCHGPYSAGLTSVLVPPVFGA